MWGKLEGRKGGLVNIQSSCSDWSVLRKSCGDWWKLRVWAKFAEWWIVCIVICWWPTSWQTPGVFRVRKPFCVDFYGWKSSIGEAKAKNSSELYQTSVTIKENSASLSLCLTLLACAEGEGGCLLSAQRRQRAGLFEPGHATGHAAFHYITGERGCGGRKMGITTPGHSPSAERVCCYLGSAGMIALSKQTTCPHNPGKARLQCAADRLQIVASTGLRCIVCIVLFSLWSLFEQSS